MEEITIGIKQEKEFKTLTRNKKFKACLGYIKREKVVLVTPQRNQIQRGIIPHNEFKGVWDNAKRFSQDTRFVNKYGRLASFTNKNGTEGKSKNLSYIVKIIQHIVKNQEMK